MKKTAFVTGACINTGVAIVEKFAAEGFDVVFTGRDQSGVAAAEKRYSEKFPSVKIFGYAANSQREDGSVDEKTLEYLKAHGAKEPKVYSADPDPPYEREVEINLDGLEPTVAFPHLPENTRKVREAGEIKIDRWSSARAPTGASATCARPRA